MNPILSYSKVWNKTAKLLITEFNNKIIYFVLSVVSKPSGMCLVELACIEKKRKYVFCVFFLIYYFFYKKSINLMKNIKLIIFKKKTQYSFYAFFCVFKIKCS